MQQCARRHCDGRPGHDVRRLKRTNVFVLLQSPALGCQPPVRVVRYAESPVLSFGLRRVDDLGFEPCTLCYDVEVLESVGGGVEREARGGFDERYRGCRGERP